MGGSTTVINQSHPKQNEIAVLLTKTKQKIPKHKAAVCRIIINESLNLMIFWRERQRDEIPVKS